MTRAEGTKLNQQYKYSSLRERHIMIMYGKEEKRCVGV
jgi:hypothetical protein